MSYSRWSNSVWYTFWLASNSKVREEQVFEICGTMGFTFADVDELGLDGTIEMVKEFIADNDNDTLAAKEYTEDEWNELKGYIKEWYDDVKEEFDTPSQRYKDGQISLDEAFIEEV